MRFLVMEGTCKSLLRMNEVLRLDEEETIDEPEERIGRP